MGKASNLTSKEMETQTVEHKVSISETIEHAPIASKMVTEEEPLALIDVTERSHFRPKNNSTKKKYYSGKKKRHTKYSYF